jgi:DNA-binding transcriptional LysR family regulator
MHLSGHAGGSVACAVTPLVALKFLPTVIGSFRCRMPRTKLMVQEGFLLGALPSLRDGSLDFVVAIMDETKLGPEFSCLTLLEEELILSARKGNPYAQRDSIAALQDAEWVLNTTPESIGQSVQSVFVAHGLPTPKVAVECTSFSATFSLLLNSDMISCCPKSFLETDWISERMIDIPVRETMPKVTVGVITRRDALATPACEYLVECFVDAARALGGLSAALHDKP